MKNPLVSVIVPTYNGEKFITQTLESIINQDYENLEIIVVDDVSKDNTVEVAKKILENSGRNFQLVKRTVNGRQSAARNTGLKASNGEYVIFFDHDDLAEKNFVSSLVREAENKNADLVFCGFRHFYKNENQSKIAEHLPKKPLGTPENYLKAWAAGEAALWCIWNFIFRKDFLLTKKLFFTESCYIAEDIEFNLKAVALSSSISYVDIILYSHVHHDFNQSVYDSTNRTNYKNLYPQYIGAYSRAARIIFKRTNNKAVKKHVFYVISHSIVKMFTAAAEAGDLEFYNEQLKRFKHRKKREILLLAASKNFFKEPELFFKASMILYFPNFYYRIRSII